MSAPPKYYLFQKILNKNIDNYFIPIEANYSTIDYLITYYQRSTGRNTFGLCSDIVTRFWCYLDIKLTILTVSHNIWQFLAIFVLNHLVTLLSTTAALVTIVDYFDVKNPFLYSNSKASPDLGVNSPKNC